MAQTINQLARERRAAMRSVNQSLRSVDTAVEKAQRFVKAKISLKKKILETSDLGKVIGLVKGIRVALDALIKILEAIESIF